MKKTLMAVFILGAGAISLATLSRTAERQEAARPIREAELRAATNRLVELNAAITKHATKSPKKSANCGKCSLEIKLIENCSLCSKAGN